MAARAVRVFAHEAGNVFMSDLAELVAAESRDLGRTVEARTAGIPFADDALNVIVAPHEYFQMEPEISTDRRSELVRSCALLTTEQPGTPWFELSTSIATAC